MPEAFCDEAAAEGYPIPCTWSDGTTRRTGAPTDATTCPPSAPAGTPFCGSPCAAGCQPYTAPNPGMWPHEHTINSPVCVGRSDRRQFGICGPADICRRGVRAGSDFCDGVLDTPECEAHTVESDCDADMVNRCHWSAPGGAGLCISTMQLYPEFGTMACVCVVFRNNAMATDGLSDYGFVSTTGGCRAYRALYPDDIQCVTDAAWHTLP